MVSYKISWQKPHQRYVDIEFSAANLIGDTAILHLPRWRPGRYEMGNFARNIQKFKVTNKQNEPLRLKKTASHTWEVQLNGSTSIIVSYNYYSAELNAGSTFLDKEMLFVNPVNCFLYLEGRELEACVVNLEIPPSWKIASSLENITSNMLQSSDMQELMDSPFIASPDLEKIEYQVKGIQFYIWINGKHSLDKQRLAGEFAAFSEAQIESFGHFPVDSFHFLILVLPYHAYHGVEHLKSTVICIGTDEELKQKDWYNELLGVSSHELYHVWNIKSLRPAEMYPYDFSKENYSRLGYVSEGVTTYFGDIMLWRSEVFSDEVLLQQLSKNLQKHLHNGGRFYSAVADASFDTWLDGYSRGVPNRKVSIYTEGSLIAFICDVEIARETQNKKSLSDVMNLLYGRFARQNQPYTENDYWNAIEEISGTNLDMIRKQLIESAGDFMPWIEQCLDYLGLEIESSEPENYLEKHWGIKTEMIFDKHMIVNILPESLAEESGLWFGDFIHAVNGISLIRFLNNPNDAHYTVEIERNQQRHFIKFAFRKLPAFLNYSLKKAGYFRRKEQNFLFWKYAGLFSGTSIK